MSFKKNVPCDIDNLYMLGLPEAAYREEDAVTTVQILLFTFSRYSHVFA
jgi:hypothetical protein